MPRVCGLSPVSYYTTNGPLPELNVGRTVHNHGTSLKMRKNTGVTTALPGFKTQQKNLLLLPLVQSIHGSQRITLAQLSPPYIPEFLLLITTERMRIVLLRIVWRLRQLLHTTVSCQKTNVPPQNHSHQFQLNFPSLVFRLKVNMVSPQSSRTIKFDSSTLESH